MKMEGSYSIPVPRELVYKRLLDPQTLAQVLPGCEKLEPNPDGSYHAEMKVGVAGVKGTYQGRVEILDQDPPNRFRMKVEGQGKAGFLKGDAVLNFAEAGSGTTISYSGDAQVGGMIAAIGQRMIQAATKQILSQFFQSFTQHIQNQS